MDIFWASLAEIFEWVWRTSLYAAAIVVVVAGVQAVGRGKLPPRWSYALWLVLLVRLVLPVGLQSGFSVWNVLPHEKTESVAIADEAEDVTAAASMPNIAKDVSPSGDYDSSSLPSTNGALAGQDNPPAVEATRQAAVFNGKDMWRFAPAVWLAGAVLLAVSIAVSNLRLWLSVRKVRLVTQQPLLELFEDCKQQMQVRTVVGLVATDKVKSPSLFGFIRPRVLLPTEVINHTHPEDLRYIFLHELAHLKRGDIWIGWIVAALQSLHWFNPLIWWAFARMRTDRELACDALTLLYVRGDENRRYGGALVSMLERFSHSQPLPAVAGILENKAQLKRRLTMITQFKRPTRRAGFIAAMLLVVLAGTLLTDAKDNGNAMANNQTDVAATVRHAVTTIATMRESDPQIPDLLASVKALDAQAAATELAGYLDHERATMRRSAIFILWRAGLDTIEPALPKMRTLLDHSEAETRGMAALTLGGAKDTESFDKLCSLTKNDASAYTRRCAAYALGLLGDQRAVPVLKESVNDTDSNVRNNADAALVMLQEKPVTPTPSSPVTPDDGAPKIVSTAPAAFDNKVSADVKEITVTFDRKMRDGSWSWTGGGETYPETTGRPSYDEGGTTCRLPVKLEPGKVYWVGINSPSHQNFKSAEGVPVSRHVILFATAGADGSPTPIPQDLRIRATQINGRTRARRTEPTAQSAGAPKIVSTNPVALANDVSSQLDKITVTFDQSMQDGSWSWTGGGDTYPETPGRPSYDEGCTMCQMPVRLEPGKVYWVGINSPSHKNFKNAQGLPASWYIILFATAGADGSPTPIPDDMLSRAKHINQVAATAMGKQESASADKRASEELCQQGWKAWGARELEKAEGLFKQATEKDPGHDNAWQGLGWAQFNQGKSENATQAFETCVKLNPKNSAAWNGLGWIAKNDGREDDAIGYWGKAIEAFPGATASLEGLTKVYMDRGDYKQAQKYYGMWLKAEPNNQDAKEGLERAQQGKPRVSTEDLPALIVELDNPDAPRFVALNKIIDIGKPAVPFLIKAMETSNNWQIPKALGAIGDAQAVNPLIDKLQACSQSPMKEVVGEALENITKQNFGTDVDKWRQWQKK